MFAETCELCFLADAKVSRDGIADSMQDRLTDKREEDNVVGDEDEVKPTLTVSRVCRVIRWGWSGVGDEEKGREWARRGLRKN